MNHAAIVQVNAAIERGEMADGHYFCGRCQRITLTSMDSESAGKCVICGSMWVNYHRADQAGLGTNTPKPTGKMTRTVEGREEPKRVDLATAHKWLQDAKRAVDLA